MNDKENGKVRLRDPLDELKPIEPTENDPFELDDLYAPTITTPGIYDGEPECFSTPNRPSRQTSMISSHKSPFSFAPIQSSPIAILSSPYSSTPISGNNVSITKSFETPSFHSPIIKPMEMSSFNSLELTELVQLKAEKSHFIKNDTVLLWNTDLETPPSQIPRESDPPATPPRTSRSKQAVNKKLFTSPTVSVDISMDTLGADSEPDRSKRDSSEQEIGTDVQTNQLPKPELPASSEDPVLPKRKEQDEVSAESKFDSRSSGHPIPESSTPEVDVEPFLPAFPDLSRSSEMAVATAVGGDPECLLKETTDLVSRSAPELFPELNNPEYVQQSASVTDPTPKEAPESFPQQLSNPRQVADTDPQLAKEPNSETLPLSVLPSTKSTVEASLLPDPEPVSESISEVAMQPDSEPVSKSNSGTVPQPGLKFVEEALSDSDVSMKSASDEGEESLPQFRYPTQCPTQIQTAPEDNLFSQWSDDYWTKLNKKLDVLNAEANAANASNKFIQEPQEQKVSNSRAAPDKQLPTSTVPDPEVSLKSYPTTSEKPERPVLKSMENTKKVGVIAGREKPSVFEEEDFTDLSKSKKKGNSFLSIFGGEDFSDLDLSKGFSGAGGFQKATTGFADKLAGKKDPSSNSTAGFGGFSTASGKDVVVSKAALDVIRSSQLPSEPKKPSNLFGEDFSDLDLSNLPSDSGFQSAASTLNPSNVPFKPLGGFSTASGTDVSVSETSLSHIRASQQVNTPETRPKTEGSFGGFATASGKDVTVSKEALNIVRSSQIPMDHSETLLEGTGKTNISAVFGVLEVQTPPRCSGFSTASGKDVAVSEKSLSHIRASQKVFSGFKTASNNSVGVTQAALDTIRSSQLPESSVSLTSGSKTLPTPMVSTPVIPRTPVALLQPAASATNRSSHSNPSHSTPLSVASERRRLSDPTAGPSNKRRRLSRNRGFHSPILNTNKTRELICCSPISHRNRPDLSPIITSPNLARVIEEEQVEQGSFITPYSKNPTNPPSPPTTTAQPSSKSLLWGTGISDPDAFVKHSTTGLHSHRPPHHYTTEELFELGVSAGAEEVTAANAEQFRFSRPDYFTLTESGMVNLAGCEAILRLRDNCSAGVAEFRAAMLALPKIRAAHVSEEWFANHYKWVVWKCAGRERSQPHTFAGHALTPENVMAQLLYRYSVEVEEGRRSALRRITEKDDTPGRPLTLCISLVLKDTLELTDGWYCLECELDKPLSVLVQRKVLRAGVKIVSFQSAITGPHTDGIPPLQARSTLKLKLNYNCVRPAVWDARLGYTEVSSMPVLPLRVLREEGGVAACVEVAVLREYPPLFVETTANGKKVLTLRQNERRQAEYDRTRDKTAEQVNSEMEKERQGRKRRVTREQLRGMESGAELYEALQGDMTSLSEILTSSQITALREYQETARQQMHEKIADEVAERCPARRICQMVKYRVKCRHPSSNPASPDTILTVWSNHPQVTPGRCYQLTNVVLGKHRGLGTTRATVYRDLSLPLTLEPKPLLTPRLLASSCSSPDVDLLGRVVAVEPGGRVVMGDAERAVEVTVAGGDEVTVPVGASVVVLNLQVYGRARYKITERSTVSSTPKDRVLREKLQEFSRSISSLPSSHWDTLLTAPSGDLGTTREQDDDDEDMFDSIPDLPPIEAFQPNVKRSSTHGSAGNTGISKDSATSNKDACPIFSTDEAMAALNCSARCERDFVTPVKPLNHADIFD